MVIGGVDSEELMNQQNVHLAAAISADDMEEIAEGYMNIPDKEASRGL